MAHTWNSWLNFSCAKPRTHRSTLLEANLAAKDETDSPACSPCEAESVSDANVSLLSEASTTPGGCDGSPPKRRASFADQQQQPLEKIFIVPSRDDLATLMGDEDEPDDVIMILEKLRRSEEEPDEEEARLQAWIHSQQEAARKTWGVKGDLVSLAQYRRRQLLRWGQAQHVFDDEMSDEWNEQQADLLVGGRFDDAAQRRELAAMALDVDDAAHLRRFFDPPTSRGLPDELLREDGDKLARSPARSQDQVDVFMDALDRSVGRAFSQIETLFMLKDAPRGSEG